MHRTINGDKKDLAVRVYPTDEEGYSYIFCDSYYAYDRWANEEIAKGKWKIDRAENFKDVNYLLNRIIRERSTRYGRILFEIYLENYPDSDQKINVWKLINGQEVVKGEIYLNLKKPWFVVAGSTISESNYNILVKCKKCKRETEHEATKIPEACNFCI